MATAFHFLRRWSKAGLSLWLLAILAAAGGCGGKTSESSGGGGCGSSSDCPKFDSESKEPVLLRYKCRPDQKVQFGCNMDMTMRMRVTGAEKPINVSIDMNMTMDGHYDVTAVEPNGDFQARMMLTRIAMKTKADTPGGKQDMDFDSDRKAGDDERPEFRSLRTMLNAPVPIKISAIGKLLDMDMNALTRSMDRAAAAAFKQGMQQTLRGSFVQLSETPVKAGDVYDAGELSMGGGSPGQPEMKFRAKYKVLSVRGDQKQAVLQPVIDFSLKDVPGMEQVKLESSSIDGWMLFDVEKGNILKSAADVKMAMGASEGKESMHMDMTMKMKFHTDEK